MTLVEGPTFCLSDAAGDISADLPHGLFVLDTRVISRWELRVNGRPVEPLGVDVTEPFSASFACRAHPPPGRAEASTVVFRRRDIGRGMRERLVITNHGFERIRVAVTLRCDIDFADLFAVKEDRVRPVGRRDHETRGGSLWFRHVVVLSDARELHREVEVRPTGDAELAPFRMLWHVSLGAGETWESCIEVRVSLDETAIAPRFPCGSDDSDAVPMLRLESWRAILPMIDTDSLELGEVVRRSSEDLGALRIFDPDHPELAIVAAGAPWFMTLFGRDSLITAWMTLLADPSLALGVLEILARFQGTDVDEHTEEEPGKILHEVRFGNAPGLTLGGGRAYYGSVDATALFVMLVGELRRWDLEDEAVDRLMPHVEGALEWIARFGDRDGDGYVEYLRRNEAGLANQGWKDSWDAIRFADGRLAEPPIALCEVQGYTYAAYLARGHLAREAGDDAAAARWRDKAMELRARFNEDFWLDDVGAFALALDRDKRPVDAIASNMGHCLWTGIVDTDKAPSVARHLMSDRLFSGWGIRTLSSAMRAFNPVSYHNGSVWPHDNALCASGLMRYGFVEEAHRVIEAQLEVATANHGRLPELFAGFDRTELGIPAAYPTSCSPQAWAAASPLLWLRTLLRLDPIAPRGQVWLDPHLPKSMERLEVDGIRVCDQRLRVTVASDRVEVAGSGPLEVVHRSRGMLIGTDV